MQKVPEVGKLITDDQSRDAIHVAIAPVMAGVNLEVGQRIRLCKGGEALPAATSDGRAVGIVDPFLAVPVMRGQQFYAFLFPGSVTSLRHVWTSPAFDTPPVATTEPKKKEDAEQWLREFAERVGLSYEEIIQAGRDFADTGWYFTQQGSTWAQDAMYRDETRIKFWQNWQIVTGVVIDEDTRDGVVFSCNC